MTEAFTYVSLSPETSPDFMQYSGEALTEGALRFWERLPKVPPFVIREPKRPAFFTKTIKSITHDIFVSVVKSWELATLSLPSRCAITTEKKPVYVEKDEMVIDSKNLKTDTFYKVSYQGEELAVRKMPNGKIQIFEVV